MSLLHHQIKDVGYPLDQRLRDMNHCYQRCIKNGNIKDAKVIQRKIEKTRLKLQLHSTICNYKKSTPYA